MVVKLQVDIRNEKGWEEYVTTNTGGQKKYNLVSIKLTWTEAESYCQELGGHLASVLTKEGLPQQDVSKLPWSEWVWLGGSYEEGGWRWSDGSPWNYTNFLFHGNKGDTRECLQKRAYNHNWTKRSCSTPSNFICQTETNILWNSSTMTMRYTKEQLSIPLKFQYRYSYSSRELVDSWKGQNMTGFRLSWFLEDANGSRLTEELPDMPDKWIPAQADVPQYQEPYLLKMVSLASVLRVRNMTREEVIESILQLKTMQIKNGSIDPSNQCLEGQLMKDYYSKVFAQVQHELNHDAIQTEVTKEDIETGLLVFSAIVYCPEGTIKLYHFLYSLLATQSPRTIIQATVNTIQSGDLKDSGDRILINQFYLAMDKVLHFELGKILLATSTYAELQSMMDKDWPHVQQYSKEIEECFSGASCQGVRDIVQTLGEAKLHHHSKFSP